jgi:hypothetical protein
MRRDPGAMTAEERLAEIAGLLAVGYQRFVARVVKPPAEATSRFAESNPQDPLADGAATEPSCDPVHAVRSDEVA